jgi:alkanesulfonate monooxygenase SsuD/methylene tetrahydromethanopterin reductase-like flavin-dependent oxidoreductase (luciferase family)
LTRVYPGELSRPKALVRQPDAVHMGIFMPTWKNTFYITSAPGNTDAFYADMKMIAQTADRMGLSFVLPVSRWKGVRGEHTDWSPYGQETITLAGGLLEATEKITVFMTVHTELFNPAILAKMAANLDHIGAGRLGLNIVVGWVQSEYEALGVPFVDRESRYRRAEDWLRAVRELWINGYSSVKSENFSLDEAECFPRPVQIGGPVLTNAGQSLEGTRFAALNTDFLFGIDETGQQLDMVRNDLKSEVGYLGRKKILVRETDEEAEALAQEMLDGADHEALRLANHDKVERSLEDPDQLRAALFQQAIVGSPETVAVGLAEWMERASVDAFAAILFDYQKELRIIEESMLDRLRFHLDRRGKKLALNR